MILGIKQQEKIHPCIHPCIYPNDTPLSMIFAPVLYGAQTAFGKKADLMSSTCSN